ncbi:unnamed protein product [Ostreobium quekettii]|uniref:Uncharacterized protein n=1 Tax=Ostreobium quekettii TaxID=121088 RepID=A0A8S1IVG0_9CHLO|nr:unnamed protein product [Ostreobium quekettii]
MALVSRLRACSELCQWLAALGQGSTTNLVGAVRCADQDGSGQPTPLDAALVLPHRLLSLLFLPAAPYRRCGAPQYGGWRQASPHRGVDPCGCGEGEHDFRHPQSAFNMPTTGGSQANGGRCVEGLGGRLVAASQNADETSREGVLDYLEEEASQSERGGMGGGAGTARRHWTTTADGTSKECWLAGDSPLSDCGTRDWRQDGVVRGLGAVNGISLLDDGHRDLRSQERFLESLMASRFPENEAAIRARFDKTWLAMRDALQDNIIFHCPDLPFTRLFRKARRREEFRNAIRLLSGTNASS